MFSKVLRTLDYRDIPGSFKKIIEVISSTQNETTQAYRDLQKKVGELEARLNQLEARLNQLEGGGTDG